MKIMFSEKCFMNTNFLVYMVNLQNSEIPENIDANMNEKSDILPANKKDGSVKKIKESHEGACEVAKRPPSLRRKIASKIKLPASVSKANLGEIEKCSKKIKKYSSLQNVPNKKEEPRTHWGVDLFRKMIGRQKSTKEIRASSEPVKELFLRDSSTSEEELTNQRNTPEKENIFTNTPACDENIYMDFSLFDNLKEILEFANTIQESENRVKDMIIKYINDKDFESQLLNIICGHGKLLLDSERRTLNISSETWFQQAEIFKEQQKSLQNTIDSLIAQNRDLQCDYDAAVKKNEKLCARIIYLQESTEMGLPKCANINASSIGAVEDLSKHNERLRYRVNYLSSRNEDLEDSLKKTQRKSSLLQKQLKSVNILLQSSKNTYERNKNDFELEIAKLHHEVYNKSSSVKEAVEAGDVLLDDLDSIKLQLKCQSKCINWDKFKRRGKSLIDLIHLSRSCINELSKELVNKSNEINIILQENECLKMDLEDKKSVMKKLEEDKEKSQEIFLTCKELEINLKNMIGKCVELENKCSSLKSENDEHKILFDEMNKRERILEEKMRSLNDTIADKSETVVQLRAKSEKLEQEKESLCAQISGMNQVLSATGSGDMAKELASTQEKLSKVQAQYFAVTSENKYLTKKLESYNKERETLITYQKTCYEQMQLMKKDIESLEKVNAILNEQFETEKKTVSALQSERVRHLEERTVLTAIYDRLRSEVSKMDKLEGAFCTVNQKAKKLAMIADYNKKLGEQLKNQVVEKEVAINELQNNMKELADIHVVATKEKAALCEELVQVCNTKEILNKKLSVEMERSAILDESKRGIEQAVNSQLKEIHGKYEREHWALKALSKDIKSVVSQRNALEIIKEEYKQKILELESENSSLTEKQTELIRENEYSFEKIQNLEDTISTNKVAHEETIRLLKEKVDVYKETLDTMKALFEPINSDRERLKESIKYIEADMDNLKINLNQFRESEKLYKSLLEKETQRAEKLNKDLDLSVKKFQELSEKFCENEDELHTMSDAYDILKTEYNHMIEDANRYKLILSEKFATAKASKISIATDSTANFADDEFIIELQEKNRLLELEKNAFAEVIENLRKKNNELMLGGFETNGRLKQSPEKFDESVQTSENAPKSFRDTALMTETTSEREMELYEMKDLLSSYKSKVTALNCDIHELMCKLKEANERNDETLRLKNEMEILYKEMTNKFVDAMQRLVDEKQTREMSNVNDEGYELEKEEFHEEMNRIELLKTQLEAKYQEISRLEDDLSTLESKCALLEFERCESILHLHDVQCKMQTEMSRNKELKRALLAALADLTKVKEEGGDLSNACTALCASMQDLIGGEEEGAGVAQRVM